MEAPHGSEPVNGAGRGMSSIFGPHPRTRAMHSIPALRHSLLVLCLLLARLGLAHEGMWLPTLLQSIESDLKTAGLRITATSPAILTAPLDGRVIPKSACISSLRPAPTRP